MILNVKRLNRADLQNYHTRVKNSLNSKYMSENAKYKQREILKGIENEMKERGIKYD